jgi:S-phase kinase-associated protein 1
VEHLLNLACAKMASLIKGKRVEEIRTLFGITCDFTAEEE